MPAVPSFHTLPEAGPLAYIQRDILGTGPKYKRNPLVSHTAYMSTQKGFDLAWGSVTHGVKGEVFCS